MEKENNLEKTTTKKVSKEKKPKIAKIKKPKKKKTLKQKLFIFITIFFATSLLLFGVGNIFISNDFAMTLIFSQNEEKTTSIINNLREDIFLAPYIDMFVTFEIRNAETGYVSSSSTLDIKYVHYLNTNTFEYTALTKINTMPNIKIETYYKNAVLYRKITNDTQQLLDKSKANIADAQQTLTTYYPIFDNSVLKFIFPTDSNAVVDNMYLLEQKSTFILPFSPLYVGQQIEVKYQDNKTESFKLNYKGEIKERSYIWAMGSDEVVVTIDYRSTNKIFTLDFPADLNTY